MSDNLGEKSPSVDLRKHAIHKHPNLARKNDIVAVVGTLPDIATTNNMPFGLYLFACVSQCEWKK